MTQEITTAKRENGKITFNGLSFESVKNLLQYCKENDVIIKTVRRDANADCFDEINILAHRVECGASDLPWIAKKLIAQRDDFWNNPSSYK